MKGITVYNAKMKEKKVQSINAQFEAPTLRFYAQQK